jgi:hypothetical protein
MQGDCIPDNFDRRFRNAVTAQEIASGVRTIYLEPRPRIAVPFSQAEVVKHCADIEQLGVVAQPLALTREVAE